MLLASLYAAHYTSTCYIQAITRPHTENILGMAENCRYYTQSQEYEHAEGLVLEEEGGGWDEEGGGGGQGGGSRSGGGGGVEDYYAGYRYERGDTSILYKMLRPKAGSECRLAVEARRHQPSRLWLQSLGQVEGAFSLVCRGV
jgi:hypothetical protein